jgi:hypothetical protein
VCSARFLVNVLNEYASARAPFTQILRDKLKANKKLVAPNMELTEAEAKTFWPIYEEYQKELQKINRRIFNLLESYAADFRGKSLTDEKAKKLIDKAVKIDPAEADLESVYAPKLSKVLPVKKSCPMPANREQDPRGSEVRHGLGRAAGAVGPVRKSVARTFGPCYVTTSSGAPGIYVCR